MNYKFSHIGISTTEEKDWDGFYEPGKIHFTDFNKDEYSIEWLRFDRGSYIHELVRTLPHIAYQVDNMEDALRGKEILVKTFSPGDGFNVACYTADLWTAAAKHWIVDHERRQDKSKPFFMYLAYDTPHAVDELPTQKYPAGSGLHGGIQWIGKPGHFINTASGKIDSYINPDYASATYDNDGNPSTPKVAWSDTYKRYATANRRIDYAVGDIVRLLKDLKMDSNTVIVYTSDNGPSIETYLGKQQQWEADHLPTFFGSYGPFDGIKRDDWEGGVRMPTIAWWPGHIPAGNVVKVPSISYDWAPTFVDMAGEASSGRMDGVSLLPSLTGKGKQHNGFIYIKYYQKRKTPEFKEFAAAHKGRRRDQMQNIRLDDYVGIRYNIQSPDDSFEIYDVANDPKEINNLALNPDEKVTIERKQSLNDSVSDWIRIGELEAYMKTRVLQVRRLDASASRPFDNMLVSPVKAKVVSGLNWKMFEADFPWISQVGDLKASASGKINLPTEDLNNKRNSGILFIHGYINIPKASNYTFYLTADSKAFLRIHDAQIIDEDFDYQGNQERSASILLKAGLHPFRLYYKNSESENRKLDFKWSRSGFSKQSISASAFFRDKDAKQIATSDLFNYINF